MRVNLRINNKPISLSVKAKCTKLMASKVAMRPLATCTRTDAHALMSAHVCYCSVRLRHTRTSMSPANKVDRSACARALLWWGVAGASVRPHVTRHHRSACMPLFIRIRAAMEFPYFPHCTAHFGDQGLGALHVLESKELVQRVGGVGHRFDVFQVSKFCFFFI